MPDLLCLSCGCETEGEISPSNVRVPLCKRCADKEREHGMWAPLPDGTPASIGNKKKYCRCGECGGDGEVTCDECNGRGTVPCENCEGKGVKELDAKGG